MYFVHLKDFEDADQFVIGEIGEKDQLLLPCCEVDQLITETLPYLFEGFAPQDIEQVDHDM